MEDEIVDNINKNHEPEKPAPSQRKLEALKGARQAKQVKKEYIDTFNTAYLDHLDNIHTNLQALNKQVNTITAYIGNKQEDIPKKRKTPPTENESDEEEQVSKKKKIDPDIEKMEKDQIEKQDSLIGYLPSFRLGQAAAIGFSSIALYYLRNMTAETVKKRSLPLRKV